MKLKVDENISRAAVARLRDAGHDVAMVHDQGLCGSSDPGLLDVCAEEGRGLVSLDMDFANPLRYRPSDHAGIVVFRLPRRPGPNDLLRACDTLIQGLVGRDPGGKLWIVQGQRIREYQEEPGE